MKSNARCWRPPLAVFMIAASWLTGCAQSALNSCNAAMASASDGGETSGVIDLVAYDAFVCSPDDPLDQDAAGR
jgi:hypothetical protein